jgi:hypothetical protein
MPLRQKHFHDWRRLPQRTRTDAGRQSRPWSQRVRQEMGLHRCEVTRGTPIPFRARKVPLCPAVCLPHPGRRDVWDLPAQYPPLHLTQGLLPAYRVGPRKNIRLDADEVERVMLANPVVGPTTKQKEAAPGKEAAPKSCDQQHNQGTHSGQARYALREALGTRRIGHSGL